jgi:cobalt-precorrin 5A hydrolase
VKTAVYALTALGVSLGAKIAAATHADLYVPPRYVKNVVVPGTTAIVTDQGHTACIRKLFSSYEELVFVMACGIVVRGIAPLLQSKVSDPAVVVVDEKGMHAISLLSGHIGGANDLAVRVSAITGGTPVITTATDVNQVAAFDLIARDNNCIIENIGALRHISASLLNGETVSLWSDCRMEGSLPLGVVPASGGETPDCAVLLSNRTDIDIPATWLLKLRPRNLVIGIGCKKGIPAPKLHQAVMDFLHRCARSPLSVFMLASIDLKAREEAILQLAQELNVEFRTFSAFELQHYDAGQTDSEFVRNVTGTGSVAEAAAILAGASSTLLCGKTIYPGITLALAEEEQHIRI